MTKEPHNDRYACAISLVEENCTVQTALSPDADD